jgi:hypothetical protein
LRVREERLGRKRQAIFLFATEEELDSVTWNPFEECENLGNDTLEELFGLTINVFAGGNVYGASHFKHANRRALAEGFDRIQGERTIRKLSDALDPIRKDVQRRDVEHACNVVESLARFKRLEMQAGLQHARFNQIIEHGGVFFLRAPMTSRPVLGAEIASLALFFIIQAMRRRKYAGEAPRHGILFCDEFQQAVGDGSRILIQQARSMGLALVLGCQSADELKLHRADVLATAEANANVEIHFTFTKESRKRFIELSGDERIRLRRQTINADGVVIEGWSEQIVPRLTNDDLTVIESAPNDAILLVRQGRGQQEFDGYPHHIRIPYPSTKEEYDRMVSRTPPRRPPPSPKPLEEPPQKPGEERQTKPKPKKPQDPNRRKKMLDL